MNDEIRSYMNSYQNPKPKRKIEVDQSKTKDTFYTTNKFFLNAKEEKEIIKETEYEFERRQGFKRIFPTVDYQYYKQFFVQERPLNAFLDQRVMAKRRINQETTNLIKQRIIQQQMGGDKS